MSRPRIDPNADRLCENLTPQGGRPAPWEIETRRGALNLRRDGSEHRKYHSLYDDLLN